MNLHEGCGAPCTLLRCIYLYGAVLACSGMLSQEDDEDCCKPSRCILQDAAKPQNVVDARKWIKDWRAQGLEQRLPREEPVKQRN